MADIVNLRQARKQKARADAECAAAQSRAVHGRSRAERELDRRVAETTEKFVSRHRRDTVAPEGGSPTNDPRRGRE